jgi:multisubunit Na+/H+ antiporter MnhG subunit
MIGAITISVIAITIGTIAIIRMNNTFKRIKELENRLDQYYKQRKKRLDNIQ